MISEDHIFFLNGNEHSDSWIAVGIKSELKVNHHVGAFDLAKTFFNQQEGNYIFGWMGYDLKNDLEQLTSKHLSTQNFPLMYWMVPKHLARWNGEKLDVIYGDELLIGAFLEDYLAEQKNRSGVISMSASISKDDYLDRVKQVKEHIQLGDIYEANFCYEFSGEGEIEPLAAYQKLNAKTRAPFSVFARRDHQYILSASPERFVCKRGNKVISQPIKGTKRRGKNEIEDERMKQELATSPKDRSENIMIVDLVRNDLSRIADPKSVLVEELCGIYTFPNIHQMISTVSAKVSDHHVLDVVKALFPMGSMTGAPKIRAMEIIEEVEVNQRGIYSGCIGYFSPNGDFDLNVVIRTIFYDEERKKVSFSVGGAITDLSDPEDEYDETLLKAQAMLSVLTE